MTEENNQQALAGESPSALAAGSAPTPQSASVPVAASAPQSASAESAPAKPAPTLQTQRPIIRSSAATAAHGQESSAASIAGSQSLSRPQVPVTPQTPIESATKKQQEGESAKKKWWSLITKKMLIIAIVTTGCVVVAVWALGAATGATGISNFVENGGWFLLLLPTFVAVMAILIYLEKEKVRKQILAGEMQSAKPFMQERKESDDAYRDRMQKAVQYPSPEKQDIKPVTQVPPPQRVEPVAPPKTEQERKPIPPPSQPAPVPARAPEYQAPPPLPEPIFKSQSASSLPIARDGQAFFPQQGTTIKASPPSLDD